MLCCNVWGEITTCYSCRPCYVIICYVAKDVFPLGDQGLSLAYQSSNKQHLRPAANAMAMLQWILEKWTIGQNGLWMKWMDIGKMDMCAICARSKARQRCQKRETGWSFITLCVPFVLFLFFPYCINMFLSSLSVHHCQGKPKRRSPREQNVLFSALPERERQFRQCTKVMPSMCINVETW